jgi:hypothetical protein
MTNGSILISQLNSTGTSSLPEETDDLSQPGGFEVRLDLQRDIAACVVGEAAIYPSCQRKNKADPYCAAPWMA